MEIEVYLKKDLDKKSRENIYQVLISKNFIKYENNQPDIRFISKEESAKQFIENTQEDFIKLLGENPLYDAFLIKIKPEYYESNSLKSISHELGLIDGVFEVSYIENMIDKINNNVNTIIFILSIFGLIILFSVIILIDNAIKLALFSQRFLIRSMQLVGADHQFIQKPFLRQALLQGGMSGIIASALIACFILYFHRQISEIGLLYDLRSLLLLLSSLIVLGSLISLWSSYRAISKYLKLSLDDLY